MDFENVYRIPIPTLALNRPKSNSILKTAWSIQQILHCAHFDRASQPDSVDVYDSLADELGADAFALVVFSMSQL